MTAAESNQKFKQKMIDEGRKELRGVYVSNELETEIKQLVRAYESHRKELLLFMRSFNS